MADKDDEPFLLLDNAAFERPSALERAEYLQRAVAALERLKEQLRRTLENRGT